MRSLTKELLRESAETLTQKGLRQDEQERCFTKVDALLDYIGRIKPAEYVGYGQSKKLNKQRIEGLAYCLRKTMPSEKMRACSLEALSTLLLVGNEILIKAAWLFKKYPALFKAKYAASGEAFAKDVHNHFVKGNPVPECSFLPFKTGENPVLSRDNAFLKQCVEMCNDPVFESSEFQEYIKQPIRKLYPYSLWAKKHKAGQRFSAELLALRRAISQLAKNEKNKTTINITERKKAKCIH